MSMHRSKKRRLLPSFVMGMVVLFLAIAQGGPLPALAAIGRGIGLLPASTPVASDILPIWQLSAMSASTPSVPPRPSSGERAASSAGHSDTRATPTPGDVAYNKQTTWSFPDEPRIDAMRPLVVMTLKERELTFNGASGRVSTFFPGEGYQSLWGRDLSTMLPTVQYLYGDDYLRSGVEELLARQYGEQTVSEGGDSGVVAGAGALPGIISPDGSVQKSTVTSDEETTVIHAAYVYYKAAGGPTWLKKTINGQPVLDRLNSAIDWLYVYRFDPGSRLIKRGHTTDWGDVKFERTGDPTDFEPKTDHWTASIYDQALTFRALRELAEMNQALGRDMRANNMAARADDLRQAANTRLWMAGRGYYRIHIHVTPLAHAGFNEDDMVAIGNAVAIYCGMTTDEQEQTIIKSLEDARVAAGARKPGLSLYPAYPPGFFPQAQRNRGEYQNGGVWDWWGGVQMSAEFQHGYSDLALSHLYQAAADWATHPNAIWEWSTPGSAFGRGSKGYAGAAGTVGEAIFAGLYGVNLTRDGLRLEPRLGVHNGDVRVYQSATDRYAAYRYTYASDSITLRYGTNAGGDVQLRVLIPSGKLVQGVRIGATDVAQRRETVGQDVFVVFRGPSGIQTVTITLVAAPIGASGQSIDPIFFDYYSNHDGPRLLGAPLTSAISEGGRKVQYFQKGKLEDHRATINDAVWQYSYGLMGEEMVRAGPDRPVGGENSSLTYALLKTAAAEDKRLPPPKGFSGGVSQNKDGTAFIPFSSSLSPAPGHNVAAIFWTVMSNDSRSPGGWLHDVGLPLTEAIWATVDKGNDKGHKVLIQAFQRAILTYDPQNSPGWQVERTNLGVDYLATFSQQVRP
jgi:hypothetical protein